jgi:CRP-like cAMP-binding protein
MIALYIFERKTLSLNDDEAKLYYMVFPQMEKVIYKKLLKTGKWINYHEGTILIKEHEHIEHLMILFEGRVQIDVSGKTITVLNPGSFIGEMSLLSGGSATATVTSISDVKLFSWDKKELTRLLKNDNDMEMELMKIFSSDLVNKLVKLNK